MLIPELRAALKDATSLVGTADTPEFVMSASRQICEITRALAFAVSREYSPDAQLLDGLVAEIEHAAQAMKPAIDAKLGGEDKILAVQFAQHVAERGEDLSRKLRSRQADQDVGVR